MACRALCLRVRLCSMEKEESDYALPCGAFFRFAWLCYAGLFCSVCFLFILRLSSGHFVCVCLRVCFCVSFRSLRLIFVSLRFRSVSSRSDPLRLPFLRSFSRFA